MFSDLLKNSAFCWTLFKGGLSNCITLLGVQQFIPVFQGHSMLEALTALLNFVYNPFPFIYKYKGGGGMTLSASSSVQCPLCIF